MAYIGKKPVIGNFQVCDAISVVNNQAAYTMQVGSVNVSPESANHMIVSLNGVIQKPTDAFTVSGSTITFAANLVTGDVIDFIQILGNVLDLGVPSDATVSTAKIVDANVTTAKIADANVTLAKLSATGTKNSTTFLRGDNTFDTPPLGGITVADQWRVNADFTGAASPISSNLERVDTSGQGTIGSAMTVSSGVFTFPQTGIYQVDFSAQFSLNGDNRYYIVYIESTRNNGTSFTEIAEQASFVAQTSSGHTPNIAHTSTLFDCADTGNHKVRFKVLPVNTSTYTEGNSVDNQTFFTFIRLGDT